jgi:hypothetical protein
VYGKAFLETSLMTREIDAHLESLILKDHNGLTIIIYNIKPSRRKNDFLPSI